MSCEDGPLLPAPLCVGDIQVALRNSAWPAVRDLCVGVQAGVVTLTGSVRSYYYKQIAFQEVRHVPGVTDVRDLVEVYCG